MKKFKIEGLRQIFVNCIFFSIGAFIAWILVFGCHADKTDKADSVSVVPSKNQHEIRTLYTHNLNIEDFNLELEIILGPFEDYIDRVSEDLESGEMDEFDMEFAIYSMSANFIEYTQVAYKKLQSHYPDISADNIKKWVEESEVFRGVATKTRLCKEKISQRLNENLSENRTD